ncbi:MAG: hypothetical protein AB1668_03015 [Nanoarchaeota archaeon]
MTHKKIEETMLSILGEEGVPLIKELSSKDNISEFELANKIKKDIKIVRKMLYLLYNNSMVSFTRKKDKQKGWYIYYWTLQFDNVKFSYFKKKKELLEQLKSKLQEEKSELFFVCPYNCIRLSFDQAMDFEFHCPECGELISQDASNKEREEKLGKEIAGVEAELEAMKVQRKEKRKKVKERKKLVRKRKKELRKKEISKKIFKAKAKAKIPRAKASKPKKAANFIPSKKAKRTRK